MTHQVTQREALTVYDQLLLALASGHITCDCACVFHRPECPLGTLERPADEMRRWLAEVSRGEPAAAEGGVRR